MENENVTETGMEQDYIQTIQDLKNNTVSKADYEKIKADNKRLLDAYANGQKLEGEQEEAPKLPTRVEILNKDMSEIKTDLDYWQYQLDLRDATIRENKKDPWVTGNYGRDANGNEMTIDYNEATAMENLAENLKALIEEADGDATYFRTRAHAALR